MWSNMVFVAHPTKANKIRKGRKRKIKTFRLRFSSFFLWVIIFHIHQLLNLNKKGFEYNMSREIIISISLFSSKAQCQKGTDVQKFNDNNKLSNKKYNKDEQG